MEEPIRYYATGRRKTASARVWLMPGTGKITINGREASEYLRRLALERLVQQPLRLLGLEGQYDVKATVRGGGISGQAGAIRHGIARALLQVNPEFRLTLKQAGLLTRDAREKERKKYGRHGARRGFQYVKR
ncbi:MAG: 30S ribosomal protein S9 [Fimbriimonadales bacterium]|jgi:small subunit ribosomal protein S9|nr:30S ribosomal protein S9 [Armatimonadota bacterium]MCX7688512.1 30S ribosomal protein S9 [Fimbriimonadales bacterium]CUU36556.1 SSU ribosomal protein S9P [Armatimonadetes bacterium DC]CUU37617.1 SSU ribosomal protein S9P [Armatimonadetes bacterium GXS]GBC89880.1 30S ribosomal protein S9 [bacterium HR14]